MKVMMTYVIAGDISVVERLLEKELLMNDRKYCFIKQTNNEC